MQVAALFQQHQLLDHRAGTADPADPQGRRDGLGEGAAEQGAGGLDGAGARDVQGEHGGQGLAVEAQLAIGGVLDQGHVQGLGQVQQGLSLGQGQALAGGVGEVGDEIAEGMGRAASHQGLGVGLAVQGAGRQVQVVGFVGVEGLQGAQIGGPGHHHRVAAGEEQLAQQVEPLLRARRDHDVVLVAGDAVERHAFGDPAAQGQVALAHRILQGHGGLGRIGEDGVIGGLDAGRREQAGVGNAAGEGEDVGLIQQLQQLADLVGADTRHALGEARGPVGGRCGHEGLVSRFVSPGPEALFAARGRGGSPDQDRGVIRGGERSCS